MTQEGTRGIIEPRSAMQLSQGRHLPWRGPALTGQHALAPVGDCPSGLSFSSSSRFGAE